MAKKEENIKEIAGLETINIVISGHIDHGKTTLLHKLTGKWTDSHSEELKRGITIKLGYADTIIYKDKEYNIENKGKAVKYISFIDAPGHEMLMATMLSGAAIVDAAVLVVAANEGIKPQTREHLLALQAKNIGKIIIVQNKIDLVDIEQAKKNYQEIKEFVKGTIAENAPIIPISAQQGVNLQSLYKEIAEIKIPERDSKGIPLFLVARSFDINKPGTKPSGLKGTVLGGTLKSGTLKVGDEIEIKPGLAIKEANKISHKPLKTKIKSLHKGRFQVQEITPGGSVSIETELDMSVGKTDFLSGCVASLPEKLPDITDNIKIQYDLFSEVLGTKEKSLVEPLKPSETIMLSLNTTVTVGTIKKLKDNQAELSLKIPIVPFKNSNLGIARNVNSHWRLIGYGKIV